MITASERALTPSASVGMGYGAPPPDAEARRAALMTGKPRTERGAVEQAFSDALADELQDVTDPRTRIRRVDRFVEENAEAIDYLRQEMSDRQVELPRGSQRVLAPEIPATPPDLRKRIRDADAQLRKELATANPQPIPT